MSITVIDCTLRDGGYYNNWDFSRELIGEYLAAMNAASVDYVELGFRSFDTKGFRGACAFTTDRFISSLQIADGLKIGVMVNAAELIKHPAGSPAAVKILFTNAEKSPVALVRLACHAYELVATIPICILLKEMGYKVGINLMQVANCSSQEINDIGGAISNCPLDVLYVADSLGSLDTDQTALILRNLQLHWTGAIGMHAHDNMVRALANTFGAIDAGATWIDCTVTGMGRGAGNAKTEYILIELAKRYGKQVNLIPLLALIRKYFQAMQVYYGWGSNSYYYLAGQHGIHPTYVQEMLGDSRYGEADILSVIDHLRILGGNRFSYEAMEDGRQKYGGESRGSWLPATNIQGREVLILGAGPSVSLYRDELQRLVRDRKLFVIALNTQTSIDADLIDIRAACHPFRLLADCEIYRTLPQPLVIPEGRLPDKVLNSISLIKKYDFGLEVKSGEFEFHDNFAVAPSALVAGYALTIATSGKASRILLAGFDGFGEGDARSTEMNNLFTNYQSAIGRLPVISITPTTYNIPLSSVYAM